MQSIPFNLYSASLTCVNAVFFFLSSSLNAETQTKSMFRLINQFLQYCPFTVLILRSLCNVCFQCSKCSFLHQRERCADVSGYSRCCIVTSVLEFLLFSFGCKFNNQEFVVNTGYTVCIL